MTRPLFIAIGKSFWFPAAHVAALIDRDPEDVSDDGFVAAMATIDIHGQTATERVYIDGELVHNTEFPAANLGNSDERIRGCAKDYLAAMAGSIVRQQAGHAAHSECEGLGHNGWEAK